jgi:hypothetical protein
VTLGTWLDAVEPAPPTALAARLRDVLGATLESELASAPEQILVAAEALLLKMLSSGAATRTSAIDLLAVDALVTYAFELCSASPAHITPMSQNAMRRLAALGAATT